MSSGEDRFERQSQLVPRDRLADLPITVIGVGAIGRQVALQLASLGTSQLQLIDFDRVEQTNVTTQGNRQCDIGRLKVSACRDAIEQIDPTIKVETVRDRFRSRHSIGSAVFCCVDAIQARAVIWKAVRKRVAFWSDGRMLGEVMRIIAVTDPISDRHYDSTLFDAADAHRGSCTSKSTIYTANIAAAMMIHQFTRWLRGIPVDRDTTVNLLAGEWTASQPMTPKRSEERARRALRSTPPASLLA